MAKLYTQIFLCLPIIMATFGCQNLENKISNNNSAQNTNQHHSNIKNISQNANSEPNRLLKANTSIGFEDASSHVLTNSHRLLAEQASLRAQRLQAQALDDLNQPAVFMNSSIGRYNAQVDISTDELRNRLRGYGDRLSSQVGALSGQLPPKLARAVGNLPSARQLAGRIPSSVNVERQSNFSNVSIAAVMPIYTGGRIPAIQQAAHGRADVQASKVAETEEELTLLLVKRYFLAQLTQQVVKVRKRALHAVRAHDRAAQKMLETGLIAKAERLQGSAALADAKFQLEKSRDDLRLAHRALDSILQSKNISPKTPLFVNHRVLKNKSLNDIVNAKQKARSHHPVFAKIKAKDKQAQAVKSLSNAAWKPNVSAFGAHELSNNANNWVVGVSAQWVLNSPINRNKMQQASDETLRQVQAVERQAASDVYLLVDKSWLAVSDALSRFDSLAKRQALAKEVVRLKAAGFKEGLNTIIELNDAEANLAKNRTERLRSAYDYVVALAELLSTTGEFTQFSQFSKTADIKLR